LSNNTIIFGDSYSTFKDFMPAGYAVYYSEKEYDRTGVTKVSQTWWYQVATEANLNLILNDSWSGSTICYTGYYNTDCSQSSSFIYRFNQLVEQVFLVRTKLTLFLFSEVRMIVGQMHHLE